MSEQTLPTLERPLHLLGFFTMEQPAWTLTELARASGLPKASCLRAIRVLEKHALLKRDGDRYRLGARFIYFGRIVQDSYPPRRVALPYLEKLRDVIGNTTQWAVLDGEEAVYTDVIPARSVIRLYNNPGRHIPLYTGASARLLLAFAPHTVRAAVLRRPRHAYTPATPTAEDPLRALLNVTQRTWLAASFGEYVEHSAEVAAPVFGTHGQLVAAISIGTAAAQYETRDVLLRDLYALSDTACEISIALGYTGPWLADPLAFADTLDEQHQLLTRPHGH